jgi:site-specific recombinase XerD
MAFQAGKGLHIFFYREVLKLEAACDDIPRMKPGKQLPKVYSQKDIGNFLSHEHNEKHRLVLMLAPPSPSFGGVMSAIRPRHTLSNFAA